MKRLLILSGKGGTGKTTTAAAFIQFSKSRAIADCDVDAPNLHIVTEKNNECKTKDFIGSNKAVIDENACVHCGICAEKCRFDAILDKGKSYYVDEYNCEGCGVCQYVCPKDAVRLVEDVAGEQKLYLGDAVFSTATLKMSRGNSGKLVTAVKLDMLKHAPETELAIVDGSPGIGCPVIASVSGMDLVLVVAEPSISGLHDLKRLVKTTDTLGTKLAVCVNKWDQSPENTECIVSFCEENKIPFTGKIPYDKTASKAINEGKSLAEIDCAARTALLEVYENVRGLLGLAQKN
ncbi:MAG: 4Fe-4S binding protein [Lachnospiraceae bacterium]|nr:4Fe-4S binding protein [Lachnospiraceae bacterium]